MDCRTCVHWQRQEWHANRWGTCTAIPHTSERRDDSRAVAADYEGYDARLDTRDDFGCVLWSGEIAEWRRLGDVPRGWYFRLNADDPRWRLLNTEATWLWDKDAKVLCRPPKGEITVTLTADSSKACEALEAAGESARRLREVTATEPETDTEAPDA